MEKEVVLSRIQECGVVAVVRAENAAQALKIADACIRAGIAAIEVTFTVPGALEVIAELAKTYQKGEVLIGAGTVLDPETARAAILAGAQFVVSPCLNEEVVRTCLRYRIACMPGAMTVPQILIDDQAPWRIDAERMAGKAGNTPFDGLPVQGRVRRVFKGGREIG